MAGSRRVAAIDVGSTAVRLSCLTVDAAGRQLARDDLRIALRLGTEVFANGCLSAALQAELQACCVELAARLRDLQGALPPLLAVGTSALREARNGAAAAAAVHASTGIALQPISGAHESRLMRGVLARAVGQLPAQALFLDLGGGSLELQRASARVGRSLPLGAVRLLSRFPALAGPLTGAAWAAQAAAVQAVLEPPLAGLAAAPQVVGAGGNLEILARLLAADGQLPARVSTASLAALLPELAALDQAARCQRYGLRPERADIIVPALLILLAVLQQCGSATLWVPGTGLRDGLLHALLLPPSLALPPGPGQSARRWGRQLLLALQPLQPLWPVALRPLEAALAQAGGHRGALQRLQGAGRAVAEALLASLPNAGGGAAVDVGGGFSGRGGQVRDVDVGGVGHEAGALPPVLVAVAQLAWALRYEAPPRRPLAVQLWPAPAQLALPVVPPSGPWEKLEAALGQALRPTLG